MQTYIKTITDHWQPKSDPEQAHEKLWDTIIDVDCKAHREALQHAKEKVTTLLMSYHLESDHLNDLDSFLYGLIQEIQDERFFDDDPGDQSWRQQIREDWQKHDHQSK